MRNFITEYFPAYLMLFGIVLGNIQKVISLNSVGV